MVSIAQPQGKKPPTESIVVSGSDRFSHISDVSVYPGQDLILELPITASQFPRLENIASAYQSFQIEKMSFRINPQISTATNGGYVAGYSRDPLEQIGTGSNALNAITALHGAVTKKWWEDSIVRSFGGPKCLFTQESGDERLYSDGIFYLAADGKATTSGALTIYVDYTVRLIKPVLRGVEEPVVHYADELLLKNLYYVYPDGISEIGGYLIAIDSGGKADNLSTAVPGIDEYFAENPEAQKTFGIDKVYTVPGLNNADTVEYVFTPFQFRYNPSLVEGKSGFEVLVVGQANFPDTAYFGNRYSFVSGNATLYTVPGPLADHSLRSYGIKVPTNEGVLRKGIETLCRRK